MSITQAQGLLLSNDHLAMQLLDPPLTAEILEDVEREVAILLEQIAWSTEEEPPARLDPPLPELRRVVHAMYHPEECPWLWN